MAGVGLGSGEGGRQGARRRRVGSLPLDQGCMARCPRATEMSSGMSSGTCLEGGWGWDLAGLGQAWVAGVGLGSGEGGRQNSVHRSIVGHFYGSHTWLGVARPTKSDPRKWVTFSLGFSAPSPIAPSWVTLWVTYGLG